MRKLLWIAVLWVTLSLGATARANDTKRAAESFRAAQSAFEHAEFTKAASLFEAANTLSPHPTTVLNAAEAWELADKPERAAELCDMVIDENADPRYVASAKARLKRLESKVATITFRWTRAFAVRIDDRDPIAAPPNKRLRPGEHVVAASETGDRTRTFERKLELHAGEQVEIDLDAMVPPRPHPFPTPLPAPPPPTPQPQRRPNAGPPLGSFIAWGASTVAAAGAIYFGTRTLAAQDDFNANPTSQTRDDFYAQRTATNVFVGAAVVGVVVGAAIWFLSRHDSPRTNTVGPLQGAFLFRQSSPVARSDQ